MRPATKRGKPKAALRQKAAHRPSPLRPNATLIPKEEEGDEEDDEETDLAAAIANMHPDDLDPTVLSALPASMQVNRPTWHLEESASKLLASVCLVGNANFHPVA